jgi:hypothetical protein
MNSLEKRVEKLEQTAKPGTYPTVLHRMIIDIDGSMTATLNGQQFQSERGETEEEFKQRLAGPEVGWVVRPIIEPKRMAA